MVSTLKSLSRVILRRDPAIVASVQKRLEQTPHFHGRSDQFSFECKDGVLVVRGMVPTYYLKDSLDLALQGIQGVIQLDNQVDVSLPIN